MPLATVLTERLGLTHPIVQAPLAGGGDTPALVAAVSEAGGLGFIGAAYLTAAQIAESAKEVQARTGRPFGINLFAPLPAPAPVDTAPALARVAPYYAELGLERPAPPALPSDTFDVQLAAALDSGAAVFSFTFGVLPAAALAAIKARGMFVMGTATTVEEAIALERAGVDAVVTQGSEAGGHRGTFLGDFDSGMVGTLALIPQVADAVRVPVVGSGGIMDGRGVAAALVLGAAAAQMGTAFLTCEEAGVPPAYKDRPARGIVNRFMREMDTGDVLPFPLQNALTRPLRTAAARANRAEFLSLWAGQGVRMARRQKAADLVARLAAEADAALDTLCLKR